MKYDVNNVKLFETLSVVDSQFNNNENNNNNLYNNKHFNYYDEKQELEHLYNNNNINYHKEKINKMNFLPDTKINKYNRNVEDNSIDLNTFTNNISGSLYNVNSLNNKNINNVNNVNNINNIVININNIRYERENFSNNTKNLNEINKEIIKDKNVTKVKKKSSVRIIDLISNIKEDNDRFKFSENERTLNNDNREFPSIDENNNKLDSNRRIINNNNISINNEKLSNLASSNIKNKDITNSLDLDDEVESEIMEDINTKIGMYNFTFNTKIKNIKSPQISLRKKSYAGTSNKK